MSVLSAVSGMEVSRQGRLSKYHRLMEERGGQSGGRRLPLRHARKQRSEKT
jgi:hypothetical protein